MDPRMLPPTGVNEDVDDTAMITLNSAENEEEMDEDYEAQCKLQQAWLTRIKEEEKTHKGFRDRAREVSDIYNQDFAGDTDPLYVPLLWSVIQVEHSGIYSSQPIPDVRPANDEANPDFRKASDVLERGIAHFVDKQSFDDNFHRTVDDFLAPGLGIIRVKLKSEIIDTPVNIPDPPPEIAWRMDQDDWDALDEVRRTKTEKSIGEQNIQWAYTPYDRFGWEPCNSWEDCDWIYFRHRMTQTQIKKRFGRTIAASKDPNDTNNNQSWKRKTYDIYEIWDKANKKQLFFAKNEKTPIEVNDDPLDLAEFWPIPAPLMTNLPSDELIPKADYEFIEAYDKELNTLQKRRMALMDQIKATGAHDAGMPELADIYQQNDGESMPIPNLAARMTQGSQAGFEAIMFSLPLEEKVVVLAKLTEQIQFVKANVDEIMGIADIVRGVSNAKEGVGTQELKGRWVGVRLSRKRDQVAYTVRAMFRIMAQLLTTHFTDENLRRLTQVEITPQVMELLRNDTMMDFAIDIETDSTVAKDEFQERSTRQDMLQSVGAYATTVLPMVQQGMLPADVSSAILKASLAPYTKYSRALDESMSSLETTTEQLQGLNQQIMQAQQQIEQLTSENQQWKTVAVTLQNQATGATAEQKLADAQKKLAETQKIRGEIPASELEPLKKAAEIDNIRADTVATLRPDEPRRMQ